MHTLSGYTTVITDVDAGALWRHFLFRGGLGAIGQGQVRHKFFCHLRNLSAIRQLLTKSRNRLEICEKVDLRLMLISIEPDIIILH